MLLTPFVLAISLAWLYVRPSKTKPFTKALNLLIFEKSFDDLVIENVLIPPSASWLPLKILFKTWFCSSILLDTKFLNLASSLLDTLWVLNILVPRSDTIPIGAFSLFVSPSISTIKLNLSFSFNSPFLNNSLICESNFSRASVVVESTISFSDLSSTLPDLPSVWAFSGTNVVNTIRTANTIDIVFLIILPP